MHATSADRFVAKRAPVAVTTHANSPPRPASSGGVDPVILVVVAALLLIGGMRMLVHALAPVIVVLRMALAGVCAGLFMAAAFLLLVAQLLTARH